MYWVCHLTLFFQLVLILWMVTLSSCMIWQIISFILLLNEQRLNKGWEGLLPTYRSCRFWQKSFLRWSSFWSWRVCKQAKLSHLGHRKPARKHWKSDSPKTSHCLVRILVHFSSKMSKKRPWMAIVIGPSWTNFCSEKLKRRILATFGFKRTALCRSYTWCFVPCFWRLHYQPQSWYRLTTSKLRFDNVGQLFVGCRHRYVLRR